MSVCYVIAVFSARPGHEAELEAVALANIPNVRREEGCIRYDLHKNGKGDYLFYEIWASREALSAHAASAHMQAYREQTKELVAGPSDVRIWEGLSNT